MKDHNAFIFRARNCWSVSDEWHKKTSTFSIVVTSNLALNEAGLLQEFLLYIFNGDWFNEKVHFAYLCVCVCLYLLKIYILSPSHLSPFILQMCGLQEMIRLLLIPDMECHLIGHDTHVNHFYIWLSLGYCFLLAFEMYYYVRVLSSGKICMHDVENHSCYTVLFPCVSTYLLGSFVF